MKFIQLKNLLILGLIIIVGITVFFLTDRAKKPSITSFTSPKEEKSESQSPRVISTKPDLLSGETIIAATDTIELIFNRPLENAPELKLRLEPKSDYKVELSFDRQTAKIIPLQPFELGTAYTLTILKDSKFDGGGRLDKDLSLHFRTVRYRGI